MAAPKTVKTYDLDGSLKDFEIPFEYLARKFVVVTLLGKDRKELVLNVDYRFTQRTVITTTQTWGAANGYERIEIKRVTSATERLVDFSDGSILRASDLNTATVQALHVAEEGRDIATDTIGVDNSGNLDARGRRIVNLGDAVDPGDAVSLRQLQEFDASALNSAQKAKVSETNAKASENAAKASETKAGTSESNAKTSEINAERSKLAAGVSEGNANQSALSAALSASSASSSEVNTKALSDRFLKPAASNPTTRDDGSPLKVGDRYLNTTVPGLEMIYKATGWEANNLDMAILFSDQGALKIGYKSKYPGAVKESLQNALDRQVSVDSFGAVGDNVTNDLEAFKRAAETIGRMGGGTIRLTPGKRYYVGDGGILLIDFVQFDLQGCIIRSNRNSQQGGVFMSAFLDPATDTIKMNIGQPVEKYILEGIRVFNGRIQDCSRAFFWRNTNRTCGLKDLVIVNYAQAWRMERVFGSQFDNIFAEGSHDPVVPTYSFFEAINAITLRMVRTVSQFGFVFDAGAEGTGDIVLDNCGFEGGDRGFYFAGQALAITVLGGYFEAIPGVLFDFADITWGSIHIINPYIFLCDVIVREPIRPEAKLTGRWVGRKPMTAGYPVGGHIYTNIINHRHPRNGIVYDFDAEVGETGFGPEFVGGITSNFRQETNILNSTGTEVLHRNKLHSGAIPQTHQGDVGTVADNTVASATHEAFQPGSTNIVILVTTKIKWRPDMLRASFLLNTTAANGQWKFFGDIYGDQITRGDKRNNVIEVQDAGGFLRLVIYGLTHPQGQYTCKGYVRIL